MPFDFLPNAKTGPNPLQSKTPTPNEVPEDKLPFFYLIPSIQLTLSCVLQLLLVLGGATPNAGAWNPSFIFINVGTIVYDVTEERLLNHLSQLSVREVLITLMCKNVFELFESTTHCVVGGLNVGKNNCLDL